MDHSGKCGSHTTQITVHFSHYRLPPTRDIPDSSTRLFPSKGHPIWSGGVVCNKQLKLNCANSCCSLDRA